MFTIRPAKIADLDAITEIYNEAVETTTATFDIDAKTRAQQESWFESHSQRYPILVAELESEKQEEQQVVGWACLSRWSHRDGYRETEETSFYVKSEHRGQGIGQQLKKPSSKRHTASVIMHHADAEREYGYDAKPMSSGRLVTALAAASKNGSTLVNMKADWKIVFPETK